MSALSPDFCGSQLTPGTPPFGQRAEQAKLYKSFFENALLRLILDRFKGYRG
jgi:hypothetical protein